jgi:Zn-dependent protease
MKKPDVLTADDPVCKVTAFLDVPLVIRQDFSAFPFSQILATAFFFRELDRHFPSMPGVERSLRSFGCTLAMLGSEWCHNLAHTFASIAVNKPVDAVRITFGMPLLVYYNPDDPRVSPQQHILRAIAGPLFNLGVLPPLYILASKLDVDTPGHFLAKLALDTNIFLGTVSLVPLPSLDGGPIMKWTMVDRGKSIAEAEKTVKKANAASAVLLLILGLLSYLRSKKLLAIVLGVLGLSSLAVARGWLEEAY